MDETMTKVLFYLRLHWKLALCAHYMFVKQASTPTGPVAHKRTSTPWRQ